MTLPTRDEMVERMARAICEACGLDWDAQADFMTSAGGGDDERCVYLHEAEAALTAIESVIPVSGILSGEMVVRQALDERMLKISTARARELLADEKELRFILESTLAVRFNLVRDLLTDRALLQEAKCPPPPTCHNRACKSSAGVAC